MSSQQALDVSIVIPAYNEAPAIKAGKLAHVAEWLAGQPFSSELVVVDDGSRDETAALARAITPHTLTISHTGKAAAIVAGMRAACGRMILFTDMDQATPITETAKLLDAIDHGADVAIGSRGLARPGAPPGRYVLSWGQVLLRRLLIGLAITDTQCGFKAIRAPAALEILTHLQIYNPLHQGTLAGPSVTSGFDVEFLFVARRLGYHIREVHVAWSYQQTRRVNLTRDAWRGINDLLQILAADWQGRYPHRRSTPRG